MIVPFRGRTPVVDPRAWIAPDATVIGDVTIGVESSVWFHSVLRGDVFAIRIGARTNVQDGTTIHVSGGRIATVVGDDVTIGHGVVLHACTIGHRVLVGIGSLVLDGAEIGDDCLVAAGSLVTPRTRIPPGQFVLGRPARVVRPLTDDERAHVRASAAHYIGYAEEYRRAGIG